MKSLPSLIVSISIGSFGLCASVGGVIASAGTTAWRERLAAGAASDQEQPLAMHGREVAIGHLGDVEPLR